MLVEVSFEIAVINKKSGAKKSGLTAGDKDRIVEYIVKSMETINDSDEIIIKRCVDFG